MPVPGHDLDIAVWLRSLRLERYVQAFLDAEVTPEALPELTDADLRELGLPLGPRKLVLRAIRDLPGTSTPGASATSSAPSVPPEAERRRLTVMFCDLVGSTALSRRLDPEEMREVLRAYQNAVTGEIARFEGHVAKLMGDGVLAYFGWPRMHENETERAARAGLACAEAVARLAVPGADALAARVGIATGLVVGDLAGEGAAQEEVVIGETPNLAARLQALAEPGQVVVADGTRRLLGALFDLEDLGPRTLDDQEDDVVPLLPAIATPTLVTHGQDDRLVSFATAGAILRGSALLRHCLASAPCLDRKILQLWQPVPHGQHSFGIVEVNSRNEVERGDRCGEHIHETYGRMIGHEVSAAFGAILPLAEWRLLEGSHTLRSCGNPHRLGLPEAEGVHRSARPGPAGLAMTIAHRLRFSGCNQLDGTAEAASHVSHGFLP